MTDNKQNEGFVRQRRNLMIVSLVLLFSEVTDLTVKKINVFGTELLIERPQAVTFVLWIAAIYWLIRYFQYSRVEYKGALENTVRHYVQKSDVSWPTAQKRLLKNEPDLLAPFQGIETVPRLECRQFSIKAYHPSHFDVQVHLTKTSGDALNSVATTIGDREVRVDGFDLIWLRVRAWIHLIIFTTLFTELVMPYFVFATPVLYGCYKAIH